LRQAGLAGVLGQAAVIRLPTAFETPRKVVALHLADPRASVWIG
jgi:hypothetical protein